MIKFRDKEYSLKKLFIRDEAKYAKQASRLADEDLEVKADAMVEIVNLMTGIDKGDLNGCTLSEVRDVLSQVWAEKAASSPAEAPAEGNAEGKAEVKEQA